MASASPWLGNRPQPQLRPPVRSAAGSGQTTADTTPGQPTSVAVGGVQRPIPTVPPRPLMSSPYSYRPSMYGGLGSGYGGYMGGLGSYGSMYGGYGGGMYGGGLGGMYGNGMYGYERPSRGMMALERLAVLVNSLCFTAETLEQSMHSMHFFLEASARIREWVSAGFQWMLRFIRKKVKGLWNLFLFVLGRKNLKEDDVSIRKLVLNVLLLFISIQLGRFMYQELTAPSSVPSLEDAAGQF